MKRFVALIMLMSMMFSSLAFAPSDRIEDRISDQEPTRVEEVAELPDSNDETDGIKYTSPEIDPGCGCTTANAGTYTTNTVSGNVNIRSGHSTQTSVIGSIPRGTSFKVTAASGTWAHVTYNGISGYASMSVIKKAPYTFTIKSYVDKGFIKRFSNGIADVQSYQETIKSKLEAVFPVSVNIQDTVSYESYCDTCKWRASGGSWIWNAGQLSWSCTHTEQHLSANPGIHTPDKSKGFYFDFVRKNGVGTKTMTKVFWTGHIPNPADESSFNVAEYKDNCTAATPHHIVCMMPRYVTNANNGYTNKPTDEVRREYEFTLLHELSHQLGAPDHYCKSNTGKCSSPYCWKCNPSIAADSCIMRWRYTSQYENIENMPISKLYCPQCLAMIRGHLRDHHG